MADAPPVVYSWAMESEREEAVKVLHPMGSMTSRVAQLWRDQGDEFLEHTHDDVVADLTRLRDTAVEEPEAPVAALADASHRIVAGVESTVQRLSEWDHAVMEGLRAWREEPHFHLGRRNRQQQLLDDVVDLRASEPLVDLRSAPSAAPALPDGWCVKHHNHPAVASCRKCEQTFCDDFLLRPGDDVEPLCLDCALVLSGIRRAHH
jgi:hypothetical protein